MAKETRKYDTMRLILPTCRNDLLWLYKSVEPFGILLHRRLVLPVEKNQKEEKRTAASTTAGSGCIFFAHVAGWFSMAIVEPKRTSKVLLLWSCRLAYPMPLTGGHLFECLAMLHNVGTRRALRTSSSSSSSDIFRWPNPLILLADLSICKKTPDQVFHISRSCCESSNPEMTTRVQRSRISIWSSCTLSFALYDARPAIFIAHVSRLMVLD